MTSAGKRKPRNARASVMKNALGRGGGGSTAPTRSRRPAQRNGTVNRAGELESDRAGSLQYYRLDLGAEGSIWQDERAAVPANPRDGAGAGLGRPGADVLDNQVATFPADRRFHAEVGQDFDAV